MSRHLYEFSQEFDSQLMSAKVDLVDDLGYEESYLDGMGAMDLRDLLYLGVRDYFQTQSRFMWRRIDG